MPFDANLVLCNGDTDYDWSYANLVTNGYGHPHATTRVGGFVVIDTLAISTTAGVGMSCIFIADQAGLNTDDALTMVLQGSNDVDFVADANNPVRTLATFDIGGVTPGVILGNECPCTVVRRFSTTLRYLRIYAVNVAQDNFYTAYALLAPWPFNIL